MKEFWELTLPNQARWRTQLLDEALKKFDGAVTSSFTVSKIEHWSVSRFYMISLPKGKRDEFMTYCRDRSKSLKEGDWQLNPPTKIAPIRSDRANNTNQRI